MYAWFHHCSDDSPSLLCLFNGVYLLISYNFHLWSCFFNARNLCIPRDQKFHKLFFCFCFFFFKSKRHLYKCKNFWIWKFPSPIDMSKEIMFGFESKSILPQFFLISNLILCYFVCVVKEKERERNWQSQTDRQTQKEKERQKKERKERNHSGGKSDLRLY